MDDREPLAHDDLWHRVLTGTQWQLRVGRQTFKHLPRPPRCKLCAAPFAGVGGALMRLVGKGPWAKNPTFCSQCFRQLTDHRGGAEIECSLLFADVRGSTTLAEGMRPTDVHRFMERFFDTAASVLIRHDAIVDRFVGDQAIGIFVPALSGKHHARNAVDAAQDLLTSTTDAAGTPWVSIGVGVDTGLAFVGSLGTGSTVDFTALGDAVNIAARLASAADAGEALVTLDAGHDGGLDDRGLERRDLRLKGKTGITSVLVLPAAAAAAA
jgi:adenylate cyclase